MERGKGRVERLLAGQRLTDLVPRIADGTEVREEGVGVKPVFDGGGHHDADVVRVSVVVVAGKGGEDRLLPGAGVSHDGAVTEREVAPRPQRNVVDTLFDRVFLADDGFDRLHGADREELPAQFDGLVRHEEFPGQIDELVDCPDGGFQFGAHSSTHFRVGGHERFS